MRPSLFENDEEKSSDESNEANSDDEQQQSGSDEESDAPINPTTKPVSRDDIKTKAQRNRMAMMKQL